MKKVSRHVYVRRMGTPAARAASTSSSSAAWINSMSSYALEFRHEARYAERVQHRSDWHGRASFGWFLESIP